VLGFLKYNFQILRLRYKNIVQMMICIFVDYGLDLR